MIVPHEILKEKEKPSTPVQHLYELHDLFERHADDCQIMKKIKNELQINTSSEIIVKLNSLLMQITGKKYLFFKILVFSKIMSNPTNSGNQSYFSSKFRGKNYY